MALITCISALFVAAWAAQAEQPKVGGIAAAPAKEVKAPPAEVKAPVAVPVTVTGTVKCEKDAQGVLKGVTITAADGKVTKIARKDEEKVAAFDGQKVAATGTEAYGHLAVTKIDAVKSVEPVK